MHRVDNAGRRAGAFYLLLVLTAPFSLLYIPGKLIVRGDAAATAHNILTHETLFRYGILGELLGTVTFILLGFALYALLSGVDKRWTQLMVGLVLVSAAVGFLNSLNNLAALNLFRGGDFLVAFDKAQLNALAMLFLRLHGQGQYINEIFWGLWLLPFGLLVYRSGFLPRLLGVWLMLNCFAYVALSVTAIVYPSYYGIAFRMAQPFLLGEVAVMLWLLIKGGRPPAFRPGSLGQGATGLAA